MKFSTFGIRPHLSFVTSALLLAALVFAVFALAAPGTAQAQQATTDYDADNDGLIEVGSLAQLNAIRWDLDGDGTASTGNESNYAAAFPSAAAGMGCPNGDHDNDANTPDQPVCTGYELTANLDFDTNSDGTIDENDDYWNNGDGWQPLGSNTPRFIAIFEGNGHTIANLFIDRGSTHYIGLFGFTGSSAVIRNLGLTNVNVIDRDVGGGLVGYNQSNISASYATGSVTGDRDVGGLVGSDDGSISASYWDTETSGPALVGRRYGQDGAELRAPSAYGTGTDIYADWNIDLDNADGDGDTATGGDDPWDFGADYNYPALKVDFNGDGTATWREFGPQRGPGPVSSLSAALVNNNIKITWAAPTDTGGGTLGDYQYRVSTNGGATWNPVWTDTSDTSHTITVVEGESYTVEVRATSDAAHSPGAASRIGPLTITDYDANDDGLIEVGSLAQLNAIHWDPDGDGSADNAGYADAFPLPQAGMGCPASGCVGYELTAGLDSARASRRGRGERDGDPEERVRVLAVDDDPQDLRYVRDTLVKSGYDPILTGDAEEALRLAADERPELVLLDLMLPGTDGIELMKDILDVRDVPVIFLSAYGREEVVARAFEMGAADYVVKPFSPTELAARIKAALRRRVTAEPSGPYVLGNLTIDYAQRRVTLAGRRVQLTPTEYGMLAELSAHAGRVLTYERLLERIWRERGDGNVRPMHTMVSKLRRKLGDDAGNLTYIFTEPRVGFRMLVGEG